MKEINEREKNRFNQFLKEQNLGIKDEATFLDSKCEIEDGFIIELDLSNLAMHSISTTLTTFTNLIHLNLEYNNLGSLPSFMENLKSIESLILNHNKISEINVDFRKLPNLIQLEMSHNQIKQLPTSICSHTFNVLTINDNQIQHFPANFDKIQINGLFVFYNNPLSTLNPFPELSRNMIMREDFKLDGIPLKTLYGIPKKTLYYLLKRGFFIDELDSFSFPKEANRLIQNFAANEDDENFLPLYNYFQGIP